MEELQEIKNRLLVLEDENRKLKIINEKLRNNVFSLESSNIDLRLAKDKINKEIDELRVVEQELRLSEQRFRLLVDNAPILIHAHDDSMNYLYWNVESEKVTGYKSSEIFNRSNAIRLHNPDETQVDSEEVGSTLRLGEYRDLEAPLVCADGSTKQISWTNVSGKCPIPGWSSWEIGVDVTKQNQALAQLKESEELLKRILELFPEGVILHQDDKCLYANPRALNLLKVAVGMNIEGKSLSQLFSEGENIFQRNDKDCESYTKHYKFCTDGNDIFCKIISNKIHFRGKPAVLSIFKDITERINYEIEIIRSRNIFRALIDSTEDYFILINVKFKIVACNIAWSNSINKHPRDIVGTRINSYIPKSLRSEVYKEVKKCLIDKAPSMFVQAYKKKKFDCKIYPICDMNDNIFQLAIYVHDITKFHEAEKARQETELIYKTIFDQAGDILFIHNFQGTILKANQTMVDVLGYSNKNQIEGSKVVNMFFRERGDDRFLLDSKNDEECYLQVKFINKYGDSIPLDINVCSIIYQGQPAFLCIGRDVTEWKNATEILLRAKIEAENNIRIKNDFIANISHELRTPLSSIVGIAQIMSMGKLEETQRENLKRLKFSSNHLMNIINDLLDLSKLDSGVFTLDKHPFNIVELIAELKGTFIIQVMEKDICFSYSIDDSIPSSLLGDHIRLRQILFNIVINAIKYTNKGSIDVKIALLQSDDKSKAVLTFAIADTGVGIRKEDQKIIFERFSRVNGESKIKSGGVGLGLAITRQLCELMGGTIWVESDPGKGSVFHFTIPFEIDRTEVDLAEQDVRQVTIPAPMKILVVEDNDINREMIKDMLTIDGHVVEVARDGLEALDVLNYFTPQFIFMDLQMPNCDGLEATQRIREHVNELIASVPIVAMSAFSQKDYEKICKDAGMDGFIIKPLFIENLRNALLGRRDSINNILPLMKTKTGEAAFDLSLLKANMNNDDELVKIACAKFVAHSNTFKGDFKSALNSKNIRHIKRLSHSFKSVTGIFGARTAQKLALEIEECAEAERWDFLESKVVALICEVDKIQTIARDFCESDLLQR